MMRDRGVKMSNLVDIDGSPSKTYELLSNSDKKNEREILINFREILLRIEKKVLFYGCLVLSCAFLIFWSGYMLGGSSKKLLEEVLEKNEFLESLIQKLSRSSQNLLGTLKGTNSSMHAAISASDVKLIAYLSAEMETVLQSISDSNLRLIETLENWNATLKANEQGLGENSTKDNITILVHLEKGSFAIWLPGTRGFIPDYAVKCCNDINGTALYIGRAIHEGNLLPAKVVPSKGMAYLTYGGASYAKRKYEILCSNDFTWLFARNGDVPLNAIEGGRSVTGDVQYIGRAFYGGSLIPGKVDCRNKAMYISSPGGEEEIFHEYEVLAQLDNTSK